jgi:hypothetical protein
MEAMTMGALNNIGVNIALAVLGAILIYTGLQMLGSFAGLVSLLVGLFFIYYVVRWVWKTWFSRER